MNPLKRLVALSLIAPCVVSVRASSADDASAAAEDATAAKKRRLKIEEEEFEIGFSQSLYVNLPAIASVTSDYQTIEVYDSDHHGRVFVLDGALQLTERDAPHYNEMLAHVPVMEHAARRGFGKRDGSESEERPLKALVIGGGDGYVVSELLKHSNVASIDHVELDGGVVDVAREHLPWGKSAWSDERVNLVIGDGAEYASERAANGAEYDVIVQDASDPFWIEEDGTTTVLPSSVLYEPGHFESLHQLLTNRGGVLMFQAETYNIPSNLESIRKWRGQLRDVGFEDPRYGTIAVRTYPTGQIGFFVAHARRRGGGDGEERVCSSSDGGDDACEDETGSAVSLEHRDILCPRVLEQFERLAGKTLYYHPRIHRSSFDLPMWVEESIYGE